jgi:hypothetical protein
MIWRVAVAVGRRGDRGQWQRMLSAALPAAGDPLRDWQAVVIGGGLINGAGLAGRWPNDDVAAALGDDPTLQARWRRLLDQSAGMVDEDAAPEGTRYDALRIVALDAADVAVPLLQRFLRPEISAELQMGAVSGLSDVRADSATGALVSALPMLAGVNLDLAIAALVRAPERAVVLLDAIADGSVPADLRDHDRIRSLVDHPTPTVARKARDILRDDRGQASGD